MASSRDKSLRPSTSSHDLKAMAVGSAPRLSSKPATVTTVVEAASDVERRESNILRRLQTIHNEMFGMNMNNAAAKGDSAKAVSVSNVFGRLSNDLDATYRTQDSIMELCDTFERHLGMDHAEGDNGQS